MEYEKEIKTLEDLKNKIKNEKNIKKTNFINSKLF